MPTAGGKFRLTTLCDQETATHIAFCTVSGRDFYFVCGSESLAINGLLAKVACAFTAEDAKEKSIDAAKCEALVKVHIAGDN